MFTVHRLMSIKSFDKLLQKNWPSPPHRASARLFPEEWLPAGPRREHRVVHHHPPLVPRLRVQAEEGQCHKVRAAINGNTHHGKNWGKRCWPLYWEFAGSELWIILTEQKIDLGIASVQQTFATLQSFLKLLSPGALMSALSPISA